MSKLHIRIETTPHSKTLLPWVATARRSRESTESQFFALIGYPEEKISRLTPMEREAARDALEFALRLLGNFDYIPEDPEKVDAFFENKLLNFETKIRQTFPEHLPLHAAIGVTQDTRVFFATSGNILALQITPSAISNLAQDSGEPIFNFNTFQSGILNEHSYLLFVPKQIGTLLKSEELKNLTINRSPERKLDYLEHVWQNRAIQEPFRAVLLEAKPKITKSTQTTAASIANLLDTEAKTEEMLSPPVFKPLIKNIQSAIQKTYFGIRSIIETYNLKKESLRAKEQEHPAPKLKPKSRSKSRPQPLPQMQHPPLPEEPILPTMADDAAPTRIYGQVPNLSRYLVKFSDKIAQRLTSTRARLAKIMGASFKKLGQKTLRPLKAFRAEALIARFNQLPLKSKTLLLLTVIFLFVFTESVLITLYHSRATKAEQALQTEITAIRTLADAANASLIYGDEVKTRIQMEEARTRIAQLPEFQKQVLAQFQVRSLRTIKNAATKATVDELNEYLRPVQEHLKHLITIAIPTSVDAKIMETLALTDQPRLTATYNKRLYELRAGENQIFKHEPTADGFDTGTAWIKDNTNVRKGIGLAIDGSVYILEDSGKTTEFRKGYVADFTLKNIDPPFSTLSVERENTQCCARKIWTNENSSYLYILDPQEKRLAVFNKKDGVLKAQYTSPTFTDLKDFSVDEKSKTAYLLDGTNIVSIPLSHF